MNHAVEVIERIKDIISQEVGNRKILDKDVARALGITPEYLAVIKRRNYLPLKEIADFCARRRISINWLLYNQHPDSVTQTTHRFFYCKEIA